ncbi:septum site-determining protein MinC [Litoribacillus peritrichatus]|uniref:Probable septum site-determining protein MinC n=1 Tax=Litoribacillus peritrichatus TaxID=718191 RepID=A0ABP7MZV0_9GAMM
MTSNAFALKSQMIPLTVIEFTSNDEQAFEQQIAQKVATSPALFDRMPAILGLDELEPVTESLVQKLLFIIRKNNILPIALRGSDTLQSLAQKLDLAWIPPGRKKLQKQAQKAKASIEANESSEKSGEGIENTPSPKIEEAVASTPTEQLELSSPEASSVEDTPEAPPADSRSSEVLIQNTHIPAKVISTPVRSGQQIYAKDTDLIILSQVGQGAEVIADGNIHIYGTLRGRAIAGASGNQQARIFCQSLQAELVSIAGIYKVSDDLPSDQLGQSCQVGLKENNLHIDTL